MVTAIKCGHCKSTHPSVDEVRLCSSVHQAAKVFGDIPPARPAHVTLRENALAEAALEVNEKTFSLDVVVVDGHYAIHHDNVLKFYRVNRPTEGKWRGVTFVEQQAGDDYYPVRGGQKNVVLVKIYQDPERAMLRYGQEIGRCGHCNRALTNEVSRKAGIGPVCRAKMGW